MKASTFAIFVTYAVILAATSAQEEAQVSDVENELLGELDTDLDVQGCEKATGTSGSTTEDGTRFASRRRWASSISTANTGGECKPIHASTRGSTCAKWCGDHGLQCARGQAPGCFHSGYYSGQGSPAPPYAAAHITTSNAAACQLACQKLSTCFLFTWRAQDKACHLKAANAGGGKLTPDATGGHTSGPKTCAGGSGELQLSGTAAQSSEGYGGKPSRAVDGNTNQNYKAGSCTSTNRGASEWWQLDLSSKAIVSKVQVWNRVDCCASRLAGAMVFVDGAVCGTLTGSTSMQTVLCNKEGTKVKITPKSGEYLTLCEVKIFGSIGSRSNGCDLKSNDQICQCRDPELVVNGYFCNTARQQTKWCVKSKKNCEGSCNGLYTKAHLPGVFTTSSAFTLSKSNQQSAFTTLQDYTLQFDIYPQGTVSGWNNIMHMTGTGNNCCNVASNGASDRTPGIWFFSGSTRMHIRQAHMSNGNAGCDPSASLSQNAWTTVRVTLSGSNLTVSYNGVAQCTDTSYSSKIPAQAVTNYWSDPWHPASNAQIRNIYYGAVRTD